MYDIIPFTSLENKIEVYYQKSIINRYVYSGISWEAKILTNELLKATKNNTLIITKCITSYSPNKLATLICILSNHNNLNYHMTKAKQRYDRCCEYCTEVIKHFDQKWEINCLETAQHILCNCAYFNNQRKDIFNTNNLNIEDIFKDKIGKHLRGQTNRIIDLFEKTKVLKRTAKFNKKKTYHQIGSSNQDQPIFSETLIDGITI